MVSCAGTARFVTTDETAHRFVLEASGRESTVALPVAKRFAPVLAGMVFGVAVGTLFGGRRRVVIVIPQPPPHRFLQRAGPTI